MNPKVTPPPNPTRSGVSEGYERAVKFDPVDNAGCLAILGIIVLIPILLAAAENSSQELQSAINAIQWTGVSAFLTSAWKWVRHGAGRNGMVVPMTFFILGLPVLIWQWSAFALGRRTLLVPSRLWAVSSLYFVAAIPLTIGTFSGVYPSLFTQLFVTLAWCAIPMIFLSITLSLWARSPRPSQAEDPSSVTHDPTDASSGT